MAERREAEGLENGCVGGGGFRAEEGREVDGREEEVREAGDGRQRVERLRVGWQRVKRWRRRVAEAREVKV